MGPSGLTYRTELCGLKDSNSVMYSITSGAVSVKGVPKDVFIKGKKVSYDKKRDSQWPEMQL